jgi:hypothetical protein
MAGLLLAMLAPAILLGGVLPLQRNVAAMQAQLASRPVRPVKMEPIATPEASLSAELVTFRMKFPTVDQLSGQLDTLFSLCEQHGLAVDKGEYALVEKSGGALRRFEVTLPVVGSYPQVRALVLEVLEKLPAAALSDVAMEREKIADGRARATLRLVFFVRKGA